jgi:deazaflavin-dependent oxidoreductase (nitroreductase family)
MPFPMAIARFNRRVTNRIAGMFAGRLPGVDLVEHRGRTSGCCYRTPISVFRRPGGYAIALNYGPGAQWVRNVLAAGGCVLETRGRRHQMTNPRVVRDPGRRLVPPPVRAVLRLLNVDALLLLDG